MTAQPAVIHDGVAWHEVAARLAALRDDLDTLARRLADGDSLTALGDDGGGRAARAQVESLVERVVGVLRTCAAQFGAHAHDVAAASRRMVYADGAVPDPIVAGAWKTVGALTDSPMATDDGEPPPIVAELGYAFWPTADVTALRHHGAALRSEAQRLAAAGEDVMAPCGESAGLAADSLATRTAALTGAHDSLLAAAARSIANVGNALDDCAEAACSARDDMRTIAARVDVDRSRGRVLAAVGGEPASVEAATAGRLALAAAGEDYRARVEDIGRRHSDQPGGPSAGAATPAAVGGLVGGAGGAIVGAGAVVASRRATDTRRDLDVVTIRRRADRLGTRLPSRPAVRMAVGIAVTQAGEAVTLVATSDDHDYLRPGITLDADEVFSGCGDAPESTLLALCSQLRTELVAVASTTPPPDEIVDALRMRQVRVVE